MTNKKLPPKKTATRAVAVQRNTIQKVARPPVNQARELAPLDTSALRRAADLYDASEVNDVAAQIQSGGVGWPLLSPKSGVFSLGQQRLGTSLEVVILAATRVNLFYAKKWDPENQGPPDCEAIAPIGSKENLMAPPADYAARQSVECRSCSKNAFKSAGEGRAGKACNNYAKLALVNASSLNGDVATPAVTRVAPTSVKLFGLYLKYLKDQEVSLPTYGVVTRVSLFPGNGNAPFGWGFEAVRVIEPDEAVQLREWLEPARAEVLRSALNFGE